MSLVRMSSPPHTVPFERGVWRSGRRSSRDKGMCSGSFDVGGVGDNGDVGDRIYAFVDPHFDTSNLYRIIEVLIKVGI